MKLHHIGKVVKDLKKAQEYYKETFGWEPLEEAVVDPIQKVEVLLLNTGYGEKVTLELICPVDEDSPVYKFLKKHGEGLHHLSLEVEDLDRAIEDLRAKGALILGEVVPSKGHKVPSVWLYTRSRELIELMEKK